MIGLEDRQALSQAVETACRSGARLEKACEVVGLDARTLQRWRTADGSVCADGRPMAVREKPSHALSHAEQAEIVRVANEPRFTDTPPARIVAALADEGRYVASESSFHRVLKAHGQMQHRGRSKAPTERRPPSTHEATAPRQLWSWDMTYLPMTVAGRWLYLYLILDVFSRKVVGYEVHETDEGSHAAQLAKRTALAEGLHALDCKPVLHGDNGATFKATTVLAMLHWLQIKPSYSRPRVSDDNAFVESLFRTAKYRPEFPAAGFADLADARSWAHRFVRWYNHEHRHSGIRYVTPDERHDGRDRELLSKRHALYQQARESNPRRWSGPTRNWTPIERVTLNPDKAAASPGNAHTGQQAA